MITPRQIGTTSHTLSGDLHPVLKRIYLHRGIKDKTELNTELNDLLPFDYLLGIEKAIACLITALTEQQRILIIGDFDADGATSTAVAVSALKIFGAKHVDFLVPNRFTFGYGLTPEIVAVATTFNPQLLITVDNGIANIDGVIAAKNAGMKVLITDHHLAGDTLPPADAIVNPNQPHDVFPSKNLAGVGVIFYVMLALRKKLREINWFTQQNIAEPNMTQFLDLVALGTVADVVPLDKNNRILVHQGLRRIRAGLARPGIQALLQISQRHHAKLTASDLGFAIAPRLNAAGRLDDMSLGIACLLSNNLNHAQTMAITLDQLNKERRAIETTMQEEAEVLLKNLPLEKNQLPNALCLFNQSWHQGVIGVLAGRLKDRYHRPTLIFAQSNDDELKGSARSISGLHMRDALALIDAQHPSMIKKFGGHAMAAGITIDKKHFAEFQKIFVKTITEQLHPDALNNDLLTDGELSNNDFALEFAELLREAGPWGQHFPEPLFDGYFKILEQRLLQNKHLKLRLQPHNADIILDGIFFNQKFLIEKTGNPIRFAYRLDINEFNGNKQVQLIIERFEHCHPGQAT